MGIAVQAPVAIPTPAPEAADFRIHPRWFTIKFLKRKTHPLKRQNHPLILSNPVLTSEPST